MAGGMFEAPERVVRNGYLVCFEGERMTMAEAERRGLATAPAGERSVEPQAAEAPSADGSRAAELAASHKAGELRAMAEEMGLDVPNGANKSVLAAAIAAAEAAGA